MALESLTEEGIEDEYPVEFNSKNGYTIVDFSPTFIAIIEDMSRSVPQGLIATRFHNTVASVVRSMVDRIHETTGFKSVALSGGTFQNRYLLNRVWNTLSSEGLTVMTNQSVPCNDGCISLGQAYLIRERLKKSRG
jgi:hydrogenase maturation protein HypF